MKISGFTFIRNAQKFDFPIQECITSLLPLVDELVVCVGKSDDGTLDLIRNLPSEKIRILETIWDDSKVKDGLVLSEQTNLALDQCTGDWCFYLQGDEAIHEDDIPTIRTTLEKIDKNSPETDAVAFPYYHFYGGYSLIKQPWNWYPSEIRAIRRSANLRSFGDAQTFRRVDGAKPTTFLEKNAHIYHYGHARDPQSMARKIGYFHRFWHGDSHGIKVSSAYDMNLLELVWFWGRHPSVYSKRIQASSGWNPTPGGLVANSSIRHVTIVGKTSKNEALLEELRSLLTQNAPRAWKIVEPNGFLQWTKLVYSLIFLRKQSALIDLNSENRGWLSSVYGSCDAISAFSWRVGYSPSGKLSGLRKRFYSVVAWGAHAEPEKGFAIPESEHAKLIARWMGCQV